MNEHKDGETASWTILLTNPANRWLKKLGVAVDEWPKERKWTILNDSLRLGCEDQETLQQWTARC